MEKEIQITEEIANHELNSHLKLKVGDKISKNRGCNEDQPMDTPLGYYICSGGAWIFVPYS